jgi:GAF domain-containing protein
MTDACDVIAKHVRRFLPASLCVFYLYDRACDDLVAVHVVGDRAARVRGIRIALGQRLSGWVAANRQTIVNSDASLDLGETMARQSPILKSCLSVPLALEDDLVGVLALYSTEPNGFSDDHRRIMETISRQIATSLKGADLATAAGRDPLPAATNS